MPSACVDESVPSLTEANDSDNGNLKVSSNTSSLQVRNRRIAPGSDPQQRGKGWLLRQSPKLATNNRSGPQRAKFSLFAPSAPANQARLHFRAR